LYHADGKTETDRWTDKAKLIVAFQNFANAPKSKSPVGINFHILLTWRKW